MAPYRHRKVSRLWRLALILPLLVFATPPGLLQAEAVSPVNLCGDDPGGAPPNVGSIGEYMGKEPDAAPISCESLIGIDVSEGQGTLASGQKLSGLSVLAVEHPSPADEAGIKAGRLPPLTAAAEVGLGIVVVGTVLFFPPAVLGVGLIPKIKAPKNYDVIVAIDGARTRSIGDLEAALRKTLAGETLYLTVIRDGRRRQLHLVAPAGFNSTL